MGPTIAVFGGSFNPPHVGHQIVALYVLATQPVDELWFVPTWRHAFAKELAPFEDRVAMCELAAAALGARVKVSRVEEALAQPASRTYDTLGALAAGNPDASLRLVIGSDILGERHKWYRWADVERLAPPIVVGRQGYPSPECTSPPLVDISSTEVRARLAIGAAADGLVPRSVLDYIARRGLYR